MREIAVRTYSPKNRTLRTHLGFVKRQGQCEQPCDQGNLGWRAKGTMEDFSGAHTKPFQHGYVPGMRLEDMAKGDHKGKNQVKWDKSERQNLWGILGPRSVGTRSGPDWSTGVKDGVSLP